jgi:hypothetical protein
LRVHEASTATAAALTVLGIAALAAWQLWVAGLHVDRWDYLFVSGCLTVLVGLWLARGQPDRFDAMVDRLANRDALHGGDDEDITRYREDLHKLGRRWAPRGGIVVGVLVALLWIYASRRVGKEEGAFNEFVGPLVGAVGGYLVGRVLGRMLAYSLLGPYLHKRGVTFRADPEHVDGAAGLKPLGEYYLYQALLLALLALFLLFWSLMLALPEWSDRYGAWREPYLGLLAVAILLEIAAFVAPMWHAHSQMTKAKREALARADTTLAREIAELRARLETEMSADDRATATDRLERKVARYEAIEAMPTWPIDRAVRRRMTLGNAGLVIGLVAQAAALSGWS